MVWNTKQWKEQFELLTTQRNSNQKSEAMFLLRNMRADVFKHTLFLVQQGHYYAENGQKINFPNSENLITNTRFYTTPKTVHHLPSLKEETIVKVDSAICSLMFPSFHVFGTKVRQFPRTAKAHFYQSIILEGVKSAACQISLCRK